MMKRVLMIVLVLLICMGSAMGEMKGPRGSGQADLQQGIDLMESDPEAAMARFLAAERPGTRRRRATWG